MNSVWIVQDMFPDNAEEAIVGVFRTEQEARECAANEFDSDDSLFDVSEYHL